MGINEITEAPPPIKAGFSEDRAVNVDDVFGKFEEPEARFTAMFIRDDEDDAVLWN